MASINIESYIENEILVITKDGRIFTGKLKGFDQTTNIILGNCYERIYKESLEKISLGIYIIRGDNVTLIGEIDEEVDRNILQNKIKPEMLKPVMLNLIKKTKASYKICQTKHNTYVLVIYNILDFDNFVRTIFLVIYAFENEHKYDYIRFINILRRLKRF